jgi:hypothetical protein
MKMDRRGNLERFLSKDLLAGSLTCLLAGLFMCLLTGLLLLLDSTICASESRAADTSGAMPAAHASEAPDNLKISGEFRTRFENLTGIVADNANPQNDDSFVLTRLFLRADRRFASDLSARLEFESAFEFGSDQYVKSVVPAYQQDRIHLSQAYLDYTFPKKRNTRLVVGRQFMKLNSSLLLTDGMWTLGRTWDALHLTSFDKAGKTDLFTGQEVAHDDNKGISSGHLNRVSGIYRTFHTGSRTSLSASSRKSQTPSGLDLYWFYHDREAALLKTQTVGVRVYGMLDDLLGEAMGGTMKGWRYDLEWPLQTGSSAGRNVKASALSLEIGRAFRNSWKTNLALQYRYASGDDPTTATSEEFDSICGTLQGTMGFMDYFRWQNMKSIGFSTISFPTQKFYVIFNGYKYFLDEPRMGLARRFAPPGSNPDPYAGMEVDLWCGYCLGKNDIVQFGASKFYSGKYFEDTGSSDNAGWSFVQYQIKF